MNTRQNITRMEWKVTYKRFGGRSTAIEWKRTKEAAIKFAEGKDVICIEFAEHLLDY